MNIPRIACHKIFSQMPFHLESFSNARNTTESKREKRHFHTQTVIVNGTPANLTQFPHMAALGYVRPDDSDDFDFDCGASLIADRWLLTAAHCITENHTPVMARLGKVIKDSKIGVFITLLYILAD